MINGGKDMQTCPQCGRQLSDDDRFCPTCGARLSGAPQSAPAGKFCQHCGAPLDPQTGRCPQCDGGTQKPDPAASGLPPAGKMTLSGGARTYAGGAGPHRVAAQSCGAESNVPGGMGGSIPVGQNIPGGQGGDVPGGQTGFVPGGFPPTGYGGDTFLVEENSVPAGETPPPGGGKGKAGLIVLIVTLLLVIGAMAMLLLSYFDVIHVPFLTSLTDKLTGESTSRSEDAATGSEAKTPMNATRTAAEAEGAVLLSGYLQREVYPEEGVTLYALVLDSPTQVTVDSRQVTVASVQLDDDTLSSYVTNHITVSGVPSLTDESDRQKKVVLSDCSVSSTDRDRELSAFAYRDQYFTIDMQTDKSQGYHLRVRSTPDMENNDNIITQISDGTQVRILAEIGEWTLVEYAEDQQGWINSDMAGLNANLYHR